MISTSDFKKGARFEWKGEPWTVVETTTQSPSARGGATLVKVKIRNVISGQFQTASFKAGEKFSVPDLENRNAQFLYKDGDAYHFLDESSYEQVELDESTLGDVAFYLVDGLGVRVVYYNGRPVGVDLPHSVVLEIADCEPAVRGDTVNAVTKEALMQTGLRVSVPMFVDKGERIRVDTRDGRYLEREKV